MSRAEETRREIERLKTIEILPGEYVHKTELVGYTVISVNNEEQTALVKTTKSGFEKTKTLYWCRKRLRRVENVSR
jgi:hypothetical protein